MSMRSTVGARHRRAGLKGLLFSSAVLPLALAGQAWAQAASPPPTTPATPSASIPGETPLDTQATVPEPSAAEADETTVDEVVVTGIRRTIQTSIQEKRTSQTIVDALSSEEIGELPALSIGEAIQTITGAATHRDKGGATEIAIRGLGPFLGASTFNGREATNGSGDRSVNFGQFPSELVNNIKIYKTQQANLIEGGVSGLIELETLRPLDYGKRRLQLEGKWNYSPYQARIKDGDEFGFRGTASYVDQFDAGGLGRIGVSLGYQKNTTNNPEEVWSSSTTLTACNANLVVAPLRTAPRSPAPRASRGFRTTSCPTATPRARSSRTTVAKPSSGRCSGGRTTASRSISTIRTQFAPSTRSVTN
jgi:TonB-dependent receptor